MEKKQNKKQTEKYCNYLYTDEITRKIDKNLKNHIIE